MPLIVSAAVEDHKDQDHEGKGKDKRAAKGFGNLLAGSNLGFGCLPEQPVGTGSCLHQFA